MDAGHRGTVVLVDDEPALLEVHARILGRGGFTVAASSNAKQAFQRLSEGDVDALITDINMPEMSGIELLRLVRTIDADLPVLLMTGAPSVQSAAEAVELGALKYFMKPVPAEELVKSVTHAVRLYRLGRAKRDALQALGTSLGEASDRIGLEATFDDALDSLWLAFQPIVRVAGRTLFGYEALMRSRAAALPHPGAVLDAAERLGRLPMLGRRIRQFAVEALAGQPEEWSLFINLHPKDLLDDELYTLLRDHPEASKRIVLEMTERAAMDGIRNVRQCIQSLRQLGCRIAIDDLGAGYAGLSSFVQLEPDIVKLDMSLIRDVDTNTLKQKLVGSLSKISRDMGMLVVAEGVETPAERDTIVELGCDLVQGYLFGKPAPPFVEPSW